MHKNGIYFYFFMHLSFYALCTHTSVHIQENTLIFSGDAKVFNTVFYCKKMETNAKEWLNSIGLQNVTKDTVNIVSKYLYDFHAEEVLKNKLILSIKNIFCLNISNNNDFLTLPLYDFCIGFPDLKKIIVHESVIKNMFDTPVFNCKHKDNLLALVGFRSSHFPNEIVRDWIPIEFKESIAGILNPIIISTENLDRETIHKISRLYRLAYIIFFQLRAFKEINFLLAFAANVTFLSNIVLKCFFIRSTMSFKMLFSLSAMLVGSTIMNSLMLELDSDRKYQPDSYILWFFSRVTCLLPVIFQFYIAQTSYNKKHAFFDLFLTCLNMSINTYFYIRLKAMPFDVFATKTIFNGIKNFSWIPVEN